MENTQSITGLVLSAVALAMAVASVVLGILDTADVDTLVILLGIGLFALALNALQKEGGVGEES